MTSPGHKVMVFVDGSNLLIEMSKKLGVPFRQDKLPSSAIEYARILVSNLVLSEHYTVVRRYWFSSYTGSEEDEFEFKRTLRKHEFEPYIFRKNNGKEKGVDIALTKEMLVNAFHKNFDIAFLVAGDSDYCDLVNEAKRYGSRIIGAFFKEFGLSEKLRICFDRFFDLVDNMNSDKRNELLLKLKREVEK